MPDELSGPDAEKQHGRSNWWIPAEELEQLKDAMVGVVEVIGEYREGS
jgi:hypothetical protein